MRSRVSILISLALSVCVTACDPPCSRVCTKLVECGLDTPRLSKEECELACQNQEALYDEWEDPDLRESFREYKQCAIDKTCRAIEDGACYDEDLYAFSDTD
jgi:hypothetical protein